MTRFYLNDYAMINAMGMDKNTIAKNWQAGISPGMQKTDDFISTSLTLGYVNGELPNIDAKLSAFNCRNNQLLLATAQQLQPAIDELIEKYSRNRIAVVLGTSTSGIYNTELALEAFLQTGKAPDSYHYSQQDIGGGAEFLRLQLGLTGPATTVSTACSSSGNAFATARRLINNGFCDAAIVGGADSLCQMTVQGFTALKSTATEQCQPFSNNRCGINIGEAAALFILSNEPAELELYAVGTSSDAHHISAPEPTGTGAIAAMENALSQTNVQKEQIDYVNLHGTATQLNDAMESAAIHQMFGNELLCSSTKSLTGHTLGAAAATELGLCALLLEQQSGVDAIPAQAWDQQCDPELPKINLVNQNNSKDNIRLCMSNSFAFGGNNTSIIVGRSYESL